MEIEVYCERCKQMIVCYLSWGVVALGNGEFVRQRCWMSSDGVHVFEYERSEKWTVN